MKARKEWIKARKEWMKARKEWMKAKNQWMQALGMNEWKLRTYELWMIVIKNNICKLGKKEW